MQAVIGERLTASFWLMSWLVMNEHCKCGATAPLFPGSVEFLIFCRAKYHPDFSSCQQRCNHPARSTRTFFKAKLFNFNAAKAEQLPPFSQRFIRSSALVESSAETTASLSTAVPLGHVTRPICLFSMRSLEAVTL